ncbi:hypothetical protein FI667_g4422, partial [Globisporangium splendens]
MGSSATKPVPLASAFQRMSAWEYKSAKRLVSDYKDKDLNFGLDAQELMVFDALDFDATEQISMDEMVRIVLYLFDYEYVVPVLVAYDALPDDRVSALDEGFCVLSGVGAMPSDEDLEAITLQAYRELNKSSGQSISKSEFTKWVLRFAARSGGGATMVSMYADVSMDDALEQFGVLSALTKEIVPHDDDSLASETTNKFDCNNTEDTSHDQDRGDAQGLVSDIEARDEAEHQSYKEDAEPEENDVAHVQVKPTTPQPVEQQDETSEQADEMATRQDANRQEEAEPCEEQPSSANEYEEQDEEQEYEQEFAAETPRSAKLDGDDGGLSLNSGAFQDKRGTEDEKLFEAEPMSRDQDSPSQGDAELLTSDRDEPSEVAAVDEGTTTSVSPPLELEVEGLDASVSYGVDTEETAAGREEQRLVDASQPEVPGLEDASQLEEVARSPHATPDSPITPEGVEGSERDTDKVEPLNDFSQEDLPSKTLTGNGVGEGAIVTAEHELAQDSAESTATESAEPATTVSDAAMDLNDFGAYDYMQPEFDARSRLPPPEERDFGDVEENSDATPLETLSVPAESASDEDSPGIESTNTSITTPDEVVAPTEPAEEQQRSLS